MRVQPVVGRNVAEALVDLAAAPESDGPPIPEIAGPREEQLVDLARRFVARRGHQVRIQGVSNPDSPNNDLHENGGLLPSAHAVLVGPSFEEWLAATNLGRHR